MSHPMPLGVELHTRSRVLELEYPGQHRFRLSYEFLRVMSPSAEVRGPGPGQEVLQQGKLDVLSKVLKQVGNYALQPVFDDGHDTGIFAWDYLYELCVNRDSLWTDYLQRLQAAGASRDPEVQVVKLEL